MKSESVVEDFYVYWSEALLLEGVGTVRACAFAKSAGRRTWPMPPDLVHCVHERERR
jgi:hypothetical protein